MPLYPFHSFLYMEDVLWNIKKGKQALHFSFLKK